MTIKFPKSNVSISGTIEINISNVAPGYGKEIEISLNSLKQSKSGVYCLRNKLNGRLYIGVAKNLGNRRNRHWRDLISGQHINKLLLFDYLEEAKKRILSGRDISPVDLFEFEVIIYCYPSQLTFWEGLLIDNLKPYYNVKKKKEIEFCPKSAVFGLTEEEWNDDNLSLNL